MREYYTIAVRQVVETVYYNIEADSKQQAKQTALEFGTQHAKQDMNRVGEENADINSCPPFIDTYFLENQVDIKIKKEAFRRPPYGIRNDMYLTPEVLQQHCPFCKTLVWSSELTDDGDLTINHEESCWNDDGVVLHCEDCCISKYDGNCIMTQIKIARGE